MPLSDPMLINEVHGPNKWGFFDIKAKGPAGELKLSTKIRELAEQAKGAEGQWVNVDYSQKEVTKDDGRTFVNYYLNSIERMADDIDGPPKPAQVPATPTSGRSPDSEMRIMRQSAVARAVAMLGPMGDEDDINMVYETVIVLSERFLTYFLYGPVGGAEEFDDSVPF